ncbi:MAG: hypothetical protein MnENMB40S_13000 [Rhizobiaceae bacterium MnEN-MB40S]|nr:MAG: hypothetical protein MnENMB40S_13000 [Rhizobiaceae bacterium MnEN-MB40S]
MKLSRRKLPLGFLVAFTFLLVSCGLLANAEQARAGSVNDAALLASKPARHLSEYNLFADGLKQTPSEGVVPYDLITPLFTDYASKNRFIYVPEGESAEYVDDDVFRFPVGTTLVKTFSYPADLREPTRDIRLVETRLLIRQDDGWKAFAYVWDEETGDATLKIAGKRLPIDVIDNSGGSISINYAVPNANQCKECHANGDRITPIGPSARNLNHQYGYATGASNQLETWSERGILSGAPSADEAPRAANWNDDALPIDARARSYLDVNCAHCHRLEGAASNSGLFLRSSETDPVKWGLMKRPVAAGRGSGDHKFDIVPGAPEDSILIFRMKSLDPGVMMPELGRSMVHVEAVEMLEEWIAQLD